MNQATFIHGLKNNFLCPMQCHLYDVHISKVPKFFAERPSVTTHEVQLINPFNSKPTYNPTVVKWCNSCFDVYSPSIVEYENEDIPKIPLTDVESPWYLSTKEY